MTAALGRVSAAKVEAHGKGQEEEDDNDGGEAEDQLIMSAALAPLRVIFAHPEAG